MKTAPTVAGLLLAALASLTASLPAGAGDAVRGAITGVSAITSPRLALYARAQDDAKVKDVPKESVALPLAVSEVDEDERFLKIKLDGDTYWVRTNQVSKSYALAVGCLAQGSAPTSAAAIRGANPGCKK